MRKPLETTARVETVQTDAPTDSDWVEKGDAVAAIPDSSPSDVIGTGSSDPSSDQFATIRKWYLFALFVALLGDGMVTLASTYIIYSQTKSLSATALIVVCLNLPAIIFPGWATKLANRWGGPVVYVVNNVAYGLALFIPAILAAAGTLTTVNLLACYLLFGVILGLSSPSTGLVRQIIAPPGQLTEFNGAATRSISIATAIGLLIGGAVFGALGPAWIYFIAGITALPLAICIIPVIKRAPVEPDITHGHFMDAFVVRRSRPEIRAAFYFTGFCFLVGAYAVTFPAIAASIGTNAGILSLLQVAAVVGGLFVVVAVKRIHGRVGWGAAQRVCFLIAGLGILVLAWINHRGASPTLTLIIAIVAIIPIGFALNLDASILNGLVQMATPRENRTSVLTYYALIPMVAIPVGQEVLGAVSDAWSVAGALLLLGGITLVLLTVGPQRRIRPAFDMLNDAESAPSGHPVAGSAGRPVLVTGHGASADNRSDGITLGDIDDSGFPISDQITGPDIPDRPEAGR
ncbi:MAG: MFS transporter [Acidimicrobiales bacterium]